MLLYYTVANTNRPSDPLLRLLLVALLGLKQAAIQNGAQGIGLIRSEHMLAILHQGVAVVRHMIADDEWAVLLLLRH